MSLDQQFNIINEKLQQLLKQYSRLQKENEKLTEELQKAKETESMHFQKINGLQEQISILKMAAGEMTEKDKKDFEKRLNQYIKDVDRCINILSE